MIDAVVGGAEWIVDTTYSGVSNVVSGVYNTVSSAFGSISSLFQSKAKPLANRAEDTSSYTNFEKVLMKDIRVYDLSPYCDLQNGEVKFEGWVTKEQFSKDVYFPLFFVEDANGHHEVMCILDYEGYEDAPLFYPIMVGDIILPSPHLLSDVILSDIVTIAHPSLLHDVQNRNGYFHIGKKSYQKDGSYDQAWTYLCPPNGNSEILHELKINFRPDGDGGLIFKVVIDDSKMKQVTT